MKTRTYIRRDRDAGTTQSNDQWPATSRRRTTWKSDTRRELKLRVIVLDGDSQATAVAVLGEGGGNALRLAGQSSTLVAQNQRGNLLTATSPVGGGEDGRAIVEDEWIVECGDIRVGRGRGGAGIWCTGCQGCSNNQYSERRYNDTCTHILPLKVAAERGLGLWRAGPRTKRGAKNKSERALGTT